MKEGVKPVEEKRISDKVGRAIEKLREADAAEWGDDADALSQEARQILEKAHLQATPPDGRIGEEEN